MRVPVVVVIVIAIVIIIIVIIIIINFFKETEFLVWQKMQCTSISGY